MLPSSTPQTANKLPRPCQPRYLPRWAATGVYLRLVSEARNRASAGERYLQGIVEPTESSVRSPTHADFSVGMKRFLYLVQTKNELPRAYAQLRSDDSDLSVLTWGVEKPGCVYLPGSTWSQGRNRLREEVRRTGQTEYLYYVFLDDDLALSQGDWRQFEQALLKYEPAIAIPYWPRYAGMRGSNLALEAHRCIAFDAMCNAFHREVFHDDLILPYREEFDAESWWISQWFIIQLSRLFLARSTIQINTVHIENTYSGEYHRGTDFRTIRERFFHDVKPFGTLIRRLLPAHWTAKLYLAVVRLKWLCWHRYRLPQRKRDSYIITAQKRRSRLDASAGLWRGKV